MRKTKSLNQPFVPAKKLTQPGIQGHRLLELAQKLRCATRRERSSKVI